MRNKIPAEILGLDQGILNNVIELNDINKTYNSYKLIMKKTIFVFHLEYTINQKSGMPCYLNVCSMQKWKHVKKINLLENHFIAEIIMCLGHT